MRIITECHFVSSLGIVACSGLLTDAFILKPSRSFDKAHTANRCQTLIRGATKPISTSDALSSLFDESVTLHSSISCQNVGDSSIDVLEQVTTLIEDIAFAMCASKEEEESNSNFRSLEKIQSALDDAILMASLNPNVDIRDRTLIQLAENYQRCRNDMLPRSSTNIKAESRTNQYMITRSNLKMRMVDIRNELEKMVRFSNVYDEQAETLKIDTIEDESKTRVVLDENTAVMHVTLDKGTEEDSFFEKERKVEIVNKRSNSDTTESSKNEGESSAPKISQEESSSFSSATVKDTMSQGLGDEDNLETEHVDIAIIGAGIGGLCAGAILNTLYGKRVGIYESHYLAGGCAHAFDRRVKVGDENVNFTFDSGPTIVLGCSTKPYNPLRQVLNAVGLEDEVDWLPYQGWGVVEKPLKEEEARWTVDLGPESFEKGPLTDFGGKDAPEEFRRLKDATKGLVLGAIAIPAMAMRAGGSAVIPLLRYLPALVGLIQQGEEVTMGTFGQYMDGPKFVVKNQWLRDWLDALAFSLSGLPASRTSAAAMAYVLYDMHREGAVLDYPKGGLGAVIDALVKGVEQGDNASSVQLRQHVASVDASPDGSIVEGLTLKSGKKIIAKDGVICNAPIWSLNKLITNKAMRRKLEYPEEIGIARQSWIPPAGGKRSMIRGERPKFDSKDEEKLSVKCDTSEMTGSFLHLHLALDASNLDLDSLHAHYTVMDRGLGGEDTIDDDGIKTDGPCGELNMIAVSNPCKLDKDLAPEGYIVVHAYGAGNEPYDIWKGMDRTSQEYAELKEQRAAPLWRAVESIIPDVRSRVVTSMIGSPLTHERFLRRPKGTYGAATEDYLKDGKTPIDKLVLCGDGIFPGIGVPAVALSGASAANSMISPLEHWQCLDKLKAKKLIQ